MCALIEREDIEADRHRDRDTEGIFSVVLRTHLKKQRAMCMLEILPCLHSQSKITITWTINSVDESYFPSLYEWNNQSLFPSVWLLSTNTHFEICPYVVCTIRTL